MKARILTISKYSLAIGLVGLTVVLIYLVTPLWGNKVLIVRSGSMTPTLPVGSLVAIRPKEAISSPLPAVPQYATGDVISFRDSQNPKTVITHRVVSTKIQNDQVFYETKGDANQDIDTNLVPQKNILGSSYISLPYLGSFFSFTKTKLGFFLLVLLPALFVILYEIWNIYKELQKNKSKSYSYIKNFQNKQRLTVSALVPFLAVSVIFTKTDAFFSDTATSQNNTFVAAETFATPTTTPTPATPGPGDVVIHEVYYDLCSPAVDCGTEPQNEWVEIYNKTSNPIVLTGWTLADNNSPETIPTGTTIPANGFLVITPETQTFNYWPTVPNEKRIILGSHFGNGLANAGDRLTLKDNNGTTIDTISWEDDTTVLNPSIDGASPGHSIERSPLGQDTGSANDFVERTTPTPGI